MCSENVEPNEPKNQRVRAHAAFSATAQFRGHPQSAVLADYEAIYLPPDASAASRSSDGSAAPGRPAKTGSSRARTWSRGFRRW